MFVFVCEGEEARVKEKRRKSQTCLLSLLPVVSVTVVGVLQLCVFVYVYSSADLFIRQSIFHRTGVDADCCCYARCVCMCVCACANRTDDVPVGFVLPAF